MSVVKRHQKSITTTNCANTLKTHCTANVPSKHVASFAITFITEYREPFILRLWMCKDYANAIFRCPSSNPSLSYTDKPHKTRSSVIFILHTSGGEEEGQVPEFFVLGVARIYILSGTQIGSSSPDCLK